MAFYPESYMNEPLHLIINDWTP